MKRIVLGVLTLAVVLIASGCTPNQSRAWRNWFREDPEAAMAFLETDTFAELNDSAVVSQQAERPMRLLES